MIDMYSTVVPESFQGKGIAKQLAEVGVFGKFMTSVYSYGL